MTNSLEIKQLSVTLPSYKAMLTAVDDLSFDLQHGETLALLGESGCGKSLTAYALMRLLPLKALYGKQSQVRLENNDLLNLPESLMRSLRGKRLAMIFQEPMTALNPVIRIDKQLAEAILQHQNLSAEQLKERMINLMREVEINEPELRLRQYPHQLSGGLKQRVVIAMALANNPEILIADEPTTALDVTIQAQILSLLKKLQKQYQMSLLLITHDLGVVKAVADRVCVMYAGQLVEQAHVDAFFKDLKHPYSQQLLASLPGFEKRDKKLSSISGAVPALDDWPRGCRFHPRCVYAFDRCSIDAPFLQKIDQSEVRCHLYPQETTLPELDKVQQSWPLEIQNQEMLLKVTDLKVYFEQKKQWFKTPTVIKAVDGLSFKLYQGRTLALVGESGCGKTTAVRALLGLQRISSGQVSFLGQDVSTMKRAALQNYRKRVQIVFQDPFSSMNPRMTVGEIIAEGLHAHGMKSTDIMRKQTTLLEQVNLPRNSLTRYPHQFSGGQRQRICIARALATEPDLLICDEPTSALDISVQAQILNLLKELQYELGVSYLFITHNMAVVAYMAHEVLVMRHGQMVEKGNVTEILTSPKAHYTKQLLASVVSV